jgi:DNA-binding NtrC family response regulator
MSQWPTTILIIEDDPGVGAALAETLRWEKYPFVLVTTAAEAEDVWQRLGSAGLSLVIADMHLTARHQGYEGYRLYERWHSRDPHLPFLFISASPDTGDLPAVRTGAVQWLAKPFAVSTLLQAVHNMLREAQLLAG